MIRNTNATVTVYKVGSGDDSYGGFERTKTVVKQNYPCMLTRRVSRATSEHLKQLLAGKDFNKIYVLEGSPDIILKEGYLIKYESKLYEIIFQEPAKDPRGAVRFNYAILEENSNRGG